MQRNDASIPFSLRQRDSKSCNSAQSTHIHTWDAFIIIPVCVLWVEIMPDTGMSHSLQSQAERKNEWRKLQTQAGVPTFIFSCKLWCIEVDELNKSCKLKITFCKHKKRKWAWRCFLLQVILSKLSAWWRLSKIRPQQIVSLIEIRPKATDVQSVKYQLTLTTRLRAFVPLKNDCGH